MRQAVVIRQHPDGNNQVTVKIGPIVVQAVFTEDDGDPFDRFLSAFELIPETTDVAAMPVVIINQDGAQVR